LSCASLPGRRRLPAARASPRSSFLLSLRSLRSLRFNRRRILSCAHFRLLSIILLDVTIRHIKQLLVCVQLVFKQTPAQFLLDEAFPLGCSLPAIKADLLHDAVDVRDDALNDDVSVFVLRFIEQFRQCFLGLIALLPLRSQMYVFSAMVGMARCAVPARVVAGGMNI